MNEIIVWIPMQNLLKRRFVSLFFSGAFFYTYFYIFFGGQNSATFCHCSDVCKGGYGE